jgi:predicted TIM-barrel fold metal-dependent hydrolase
VWWLPPDDRRYYPLFAECCELDIRFCTQVGHAGPLRESEPGRPIPYLDRVALEFPELRILGGHIGVPWLSEMLSLVMKMGMIGKTAAPGRLLDDAVAWAALVPPDCCPAYAFAKRALQATTMAAIDATARLDRDWLSRCMSDPASLRAHARRYRELKGREITWALPG